jgi:hypothetical protein
LDLSVEDNGVGCPRGVALEKGKSLGFRIVQILTKQVEGTLEHVDCPGTRFMLRFRAGSSCRKPVVAGGTEDGAVCIGRPTELLITDIM